MANDDLSIVARHLYDESTGLSYVCLEDMIEYFQRHEDYLAARAVEFDEKDDTLGAAYLRGSAATFAILHADLRTRLYEAPVKGTP